jgi:hypothetical protein
MFKPLADRMTLVHRFASLLSTAIVALAVAVAPAGFVHAQGGMGMGGGGMGGGGMGGGGMGGMGGGGMGGGGMGGGGMGGGGMGGMGGGGMGGGGGLGSAAGAAGVVIDAQGVLRTRFVSDAGLSRQRRVAAYAELPGDIRKRSTFRKVALSRLEAEVARAAAEGRDVADDVARLAGLTRVQYVFVYPAEDGQPGEVVIAGPAEGWITDATGRVVGIESGSPTVLLEDLVAAMRVFEPGEPTSATIGCSIDPRQEGLAQLQAFIKSVGRINPKASPEELVMGMSQALGPQDVRVDGVSPTTHFAQVMVEADYRMKLIGIGLERVPARNMKSWVDLNANSGVATNALQRWFFTPDYQCVRATDDDLGIELVGRGVKLVGADEVVLPNGQRMSADRPDRASKTFTETFTRKYPEIAARNPVYGQLRNLIDLSIVAAWMQEHDAYGRAAWGAESLRDESVCTIERLVAPTEVQPAINAIQRGNRLVTPIGGGVTVQPKMALDPSNILGDEEGTIASARGEKLDLPAGQWWWD